MLLRHCRGQAPAAPLLRPRPVPHFEPQGRARAHSVAASLHIPYDDRRGTAAAATAPCTRLRSAGPSTTAKRGGPSPPPPATSSRTWATRTPWFSSPVTLGPAGRVERVACVRVRSRIPLYGVRATRGSGGSPLLPACHRHWPRGTHAARAFGSRAGHALLVCVKHSPKHHFESLPPSPPCKKACNND